MFQKSFFYVVKYKREIAVAAVTVLLMFYAGFVKPPHDFPVGGYVVIEEGMTITDAARVLEERHIIRSSALFAWTVRTFGIEGGVRSGTYGFDTRLSVFAVASRLNHGVFGSTLVRITIPEGATVRDMSGIFEKTIPQFNTERFLSLALPQEGYLFPDTYLFAPGSTAETVVTTLRKNFDDQIASISSDIEAFGKPLNDVVIMASLLEKEARQYETKRIVAGILWKRIALGMPLQVDAVFGYILGIDTFSPTFDQLIATDSPYNTYQHTGLTPGPIANPGLDSLKAAVNPEETPYLYYLTGADGTMHYAKTFEEHVANRRFLK